MEARRRIDSEYPMPSEVVIMIRNEMDPVVNMHNPVEVIQNKETGKP
jgi:hypothetical protein